MIKSLLPNSPVEKLSNETDFLGVLEKRMLIKSFLETLKESNHGMKMITLYGDWGSGKSTLMKSLKEQLASDFNTFFFEAWEYEKDDNLSLSLLEYMTMSKNCEDEGFYKSILDTGERILKGLSKSVKVNFPIVEIDPSGLTEEIFKKKELSFYQALKQFKIDFQRFEDYVTKGDNSKMNLVFIDDLDRCAPDQVLNLLSAIKLFFTYGNKTIFFCGIDKGAAESAVRTKYGDAIKSTEYLEKIFDISFSMPNHTDIQKLVNHYFNDKTYVFENTEVNINTRIHEFLQYLNFDNPRKVKKLLNKFELLRHFISLTKNQNLPNIDLKNSSEASYFETILVLYLIILHEFFPEDFDLFLSFDKKRQLYTNSLQDPASYLTTLRNAFNSNLSTQPFSKILLKGDSQEIQQRFNICISPNYVDNIHVHSLLTYNADNIVVSKKHIDFLFYKYINSKPLNLWLEKNASSSSFYSVKSIIKNLL